MNRMHGELALAAPAAARGAFRHRTVSALVWSVGAQAAARGLSFTIIIVLARLLAPGDFGLIAMTAVLTGFATIFRDVGFGSALIQRSEIDETHRSSVFWLSLAVGAALMLAVAASSPLVAWYFKHPILVVLTLVLSLDFLLTSLSIVHVALLHRALRFRPIVVIDLAAMVGSGSLAIAAALLGAGVWSLAIWTLSMSAIRVTLLWRTSGWRPRWIWDRGAIRDLFRFSSNLLGFNLVNYWIRNADKLLIGRFLSAWALGVYTRAYALMMLPFGVIGGGLGSVMFPAMSEIQHDRQRVASLYLRMTRAVALVTFPLMIGLWAVADDFVLALYGPKWVAMVPIVRLLCVAGLLESIGTLTGNLYLSQGRSDLQLRVGAILGVASIGAIAIGMMWGLIGVATAYTVYSVLAFFPALRIAARLVDLRITHVIRSLAEPLGCSLIMAVAVLGLDQLMPASWPAAWHMVIECVFGASIYVLLVLALKIQAWRDVHEVLTGFLGGPAHSPATQRGP